MSSEQMSVPASLRDSDGDPDAYEIVEEFWPYDGPYGTWRTGSAATMIARTVRYLNNATQKQSAMPHAATAGKVLSGISDAMFGLHQLTEQLAEFAAGHANGNSAKLYDDRHDRTGAATALELAMELEELQPVLTDLASRLQRASGIASHIGERSDD